MSHSEIVARFGPTAITDMTTAFDRRGAITDDTQMSLFTAEGLLRGYVQSAIQGRAGLATAVAGAYLRWLKTQGTLSPLLQETGPLGWLLEQEELHQSRVPGHTCLEALAAMPIIGARAGNDSKGCGGVMRIAPVGLFCARDPGASLERATRRAFDLGCELAALTHGHPTGQLTAGAFAAIVARLARGEALANAIDAIRPLVTKKPLHADTLRAIDSAVTLGAEGAASGTADAVKLGKLGEGWIAEEALAIALYASLAAPDFAQGVLVAVNHDGDSDSTAAMAGNLLGTLHGIDNVPRRWVTQLELREVIAAVADDLATYPDWPIGEYVPEETATHYWMKRYPPS